MYNLPHNDFFKNLEFDNEGLEKGHILISEPLMPDPNFSRSVILLTAHNSEGAVGFILNKPSDIKLSEILEFEFNGEFPVYIGGPVEPSSLFYLHNLGKDLQGSVEIAEGLFWGGEFDHLKFLLTNGLVNSSQIKFFMGYAGWAPDQLEYELEEKSWLVKGLEHFNALDELSKKDWNKILAGYGDKYKLLASFPENPSHN